MKPRLVWLAATFLALAGMPLAAQERILTGTVTDSATGDPIAGASIGIQGTRIVTHTNANGVFNLAALPDSALTVMVRFIGYRKRDVVVAAGETTVAIQLAKDLFKLEEIVVTGQATGIERKNVATAVATVGADEMNSTPSVSVEQQLVGKVAGADIQSNSGAPGGGLQMRLRGTTSINASASPLYVVDGIVVSDIAIPSNQNAVTRAAAGGNTSPDQDAQVNRIADVNPEDIQSVEILKGAAASAIYGGRASNGVVIINTKRGQVGKPQVDLTQRFGFSELEREVGSRTFETAAEVDAKYGAGTAAAVGYTNGQSFDLEKQLAHRKDLAAETQLSLSGGGEGTRYYAAGQIQNTPGIIDNTGYQRQSVRVNLDQVISSRVHGTLNANVMHTLAQRGLTNNDNSGTSFGVVLSSTPDFTNLTRDSTGAFRLNPFVPSNPLQTAALMKNDETVWRFLSSASLNFDLYNSAKNSLKLVAIGGLDYFSQENELFFPPDLQFEPNDGELGTSLLKESNNLNLNLDVNAIHTYIPSSRSWSARTSAGIQTTRRDLGVLQNEGYNLVGGQENIDAATRKVVLRNKELVKNLGYFLQEDFLADQERWLLSVGVRADQSSLNSDASQLFWYPKAATSYRFVKPAGFVDEFKLRVAYGESGLEPDYGQKFTPLDASQNIGGLPTVVVLGTIGAPDLHPEREKEIEAGFDAYFWNQTATLEFSVFQKNLSDLLVPRALHESSGYITEFLNGGAMKTKGLEIAAAVQPIQKRNFNWLSRATFATTKSTITQLDVPAFETGGFGTSIGAFRIEKGASATQIVGNDTTNSGAVRVVKVGEANPKFRMGFINDFTFHDFTLHTLLDWQYGGDILNLTKLLYDFGGVTKDFDKPISGSSQTVGERRLSGFGLVTKNWIESASFLKLREISLTYNAPYRFVSGLWRGARYARFTVSARNLFLSVPYDGYDPEVSNFGNQPIARNIDVAPFPPSRSFWFSMDIGF
ncbi:MAG TPA: SusC/RagA family TonB-linked outer membrane protein [Gemmatimonadales bacterium]